MASRVGLNAYAVRMKQAYTASWATMTLHGPVDGYNLTLEYLKGIKNQLQRLGAPGGGRQATSRAFEVKRVYSDEKERSIWGIIDAGEFGRTGRLVDIDSEEETHLRKRNESELMPYYFRFLFHEGISRGIFLAQRIGFGALKPALDVAYRRYLNPREITIEMPGLTHADMLQSYLTNGELKGLRVVTHKKAQESSELLKKTRVDGEKLEDGTRLELVMRRPKGLGKVMDTLRSVVNGHRPMHDLVEVYGLDDPEDVLAEVEQDGRRRTLSLVRKSDTGISYDLTNEVDFDSNGHPVFASLDAYAKGLCTELAEKLS
jgi:hypothetical protein